MPDIDIDIWYAQANKSCPETAGDDQRIRSNTIVLCIFTYRGMITFCDTIDGNDLLNRILIVTQSPVDLLHIKNHCYDT